MLMAVSPIERPCATRSTYVATSAWDSTRIISPVLLALTILGEIEGKYAGQDQDVVLAVRDLHAIGVTKRQPRLRDGGHRSVAPPDGEVVLEQAAGHLEVVGPGHVDG